MARKTESRKKSGSVHSGDAGDKDRLILEKIFPGDSEMARLMRSENALRESEEELQRVNRALKALAKCKKAMIRAEDEVSLLNDICHTIVDVGGYRLAWIGYIENDEVRTVRPVARAGYDEGYVDNLKIALRDPVRGNGPTGISLKTGKPYGSRNVRLDEEMRPWRENALKRGYLSTLNLPIVYEKQIIGALAIYAGKEDAFDEEERGLLFELAQTLAYGITAIRDRVRRTLAEEELLRANIELERRVLERTEDLIKANEALRESEANLSRAQRITHLGNWEWDVKEDKVFCSDEFYRVFGLDRRDYITYVQFLDTLRPGDRDRVNRAVEAAQYKREPYNIDYCVVWPDGREHIIHAEGEVTYGPGEEPVKMFGTVQDITERKRAEEELSAARDRLTRDLAGMSRLQEISRSLVQQDNMGSLIGEIIEAAIELTDADMGNIQLCKERDLKIVESRGFDKPFLDYFNIVHDNEGSCGTAMVKRERVIVEDVTKSPIFVGTPSLEVMLAAGARACQSTPLYSRSGRLLGMFSTHYRAPHRLEEREQVLLDMLARQAADLIERMRSDEELKTAKQQAELYLDLMGHDINNMHQVALGYLELAKDIPTGGEQAGFLDKSVEVLQRSTQLIGNVRKLQKIHEGVFKSRDIDVCRLLADIQSEYEAMPDKVVRLNLNSHETCTVRANELLHDVFANLVNNAVKHTGNNTDILVNLDEAEDKGIRFCRVMVEDNGPGIPDDYKERIFNRMHKGSARGMGLGLYLVKSLVESYGGRVWAEDRVIGDHTKGARFVVMLPAIEEPHN